jgi:hypothetical protein
MPYVYPDVDDLAGHDLVGTAQCVALVQTYTEAPRTADWKQGVSVRGNLLLTKATAVATFEDGVYKNHAHGNHAAFYLSQDQGGIWVMDQWKGDPKKPAVSKRYLRYQGTGKDGNWIDTSNNGDAFSVIE